MKSLVSSEKFSYAMAFDILNAAGFGHVWSADNICYKFMSEKIHMYSIRQTHISGRE